MGLLTGAGGETLSRHVYYPYGEEITVGSEERLKFTGHERDLGGPGTADDLDYMHARYYQPGLGRFLSVDPARSAQPELPQSWNRYAYVTGNPMRFLDPDGRLKRNADNSLVFENDKLEVVSHPVDPDVKYMVRIGVLLTDDGQEVQAITALPGEGKDSHRVGLIADARTGEVTRKTGRENPFCTNCHGLTFADGLYSIHNASVETILTGDGYTRQNTDSPQDGDVVIYRRGGKVVHSARVVRVQNGTIIVLTVGGIYTEPEEAPIEEGFIGYDSYEFYRK